MDDQRPENPPLCGKRRRRHRLEALALDVGAARGREPQARVGQDVARRHRARFLHRAADGAAAHRDRAGRRILLAQPPGRAHHAILARRRVAQHDHGRLGGHDLERLADDRVEYLVEVERRRERVADGLHRAEEQRAVLPVADVGEDCDDAGDRALAVAPRGAARLELHYAIVVAHRVRQLDRAGRLAGQRAAHERRQRLVAEQRQRGVGVASDGVGARDAGQPLHGDIPLEDSQRRIEDDESFSEAVEEALKRHSPSMTGPRPAMQ